MTVKRYARINRGSGCWSMGERDDGEYVKYDDYAALQQQVNALAAENSAMKSVINPSELPEDVVDAINNTAEFDWDSNESGSWTWVENDSDVARAVLNALAVPETPATDAAIRELQAQGVEKLAGRRDAAGKFAKSEGDDRAAMNFYDEAARARMFAATLRNGEQGGDHV